MSTTTLLPLFLGAKISYILVIFSLLPLYPVMEVRDRYEEKTDQQKVLKDQKTKEPTKLNSKFSRPEIHWKLVFCNILSMNKYKFWPVLSIEFSHIPLWKKFHLWDRQMWMFWNFILQTPFVFDNIKKCTEEIL